MRGKSAWPKALPSSRARPRRQRMGELFDRELLDALGVETEQGKPSARSPREERVIAGFEEIQRFAEEHGRAPQHGEDQDIFERLYAVRLDRLRAQDDCRAILEPLDHQGLLTGAVEIGRAHV